MLAAPLALVIAVLVFVLPFRCPTQSTAAHNVLSMVRRTFSIPPPLKSAKATSIARGTVSMVRSRLPPPEVRIIESPSNQWRRCGCYFDDGAT